MALKRLQEEGDVREHMAVFFDAVDKLSAMGVDINQDLLSIMLLYSLPPCFENFRCAIESRDKLPNVEALKVKILEESEARKQKLREGESGAMVTWQKHKGKFKKYSNNKNSEDSTEVSNNNNKKAWLPKCFKCRKVGHKINECPSNTQNRYAGVTEVSGTYFASEDRHDNAFQTSLPLKKDRWCLDSGYTSHICNTEDSFIELQEMQCGKLNLASEASTDIQGKGTAQLLTSNGVDKKLINLCDTLLVRDLRQNLMSVSKITDRDHEVLFQNEKAIIRDKNGTIKMVADRVSDLYYIRDDNVKAEASSIRKDKENLKLWHKRLGHVNTRDLVDMVKKGAAFGIDVGAECSAPACSICMRGKCASLPFNSSTSKCHKKLEIIHTDLCGPMRVESKGEAKYFMTFIDDYSRWGEVYFLRKKSDALSAFKEFKTFAEKQIGEKIKALQSDNGREFCNLDFDNFLKNHGIKRGLSTPYTPQQNGVAERKNRTLVEMARCLLIQGNLHRSFWGEAVYTANYLRNRSTSKSLDGRTPCERWTGKVPNLKHIRIIGTVVYILDKAPGRGKFDDKAKRGILVGYSEQMKGYRMYVPCINKVITSRDVRFLNEIEQGESHSDNSEDGEFLNDEATYHPQENLQEVENESQTSIDVEEPRRAPGRPRMIRTGRKGRPRKEYQTTKPNESCSRQIEDINDGIPKEDDDLNEYQSIEDVDNESTPITNDQNVEDDNLLNETNFALATVYVTEVHMKDALEGPQANEWKNALLHFRV